MRMWTGSRDTGMVPALLAEPVPPRATRTGAVPLGEVSIAVVTVAAHRDAAFAAARYAIDETKSRAPIWKAEQFEDGHVWIGDPARESP